MAKYKKNYASSRRNHRGLIETQSSRIEAEIKMLVQRIEEETPDRGFVPSLNQSTPFRSLPISQNTIRGLEEGIKATSKKFKDMTDIQSACIPHALAGRDILGAARTGSGKTLAFLVPVLETLFRSRVTSIDGPSAMILLPTREIAVQIFQVLRTVGSFHQFSAGLLVGGKKEFDEEQMRVGRMNIIIGTPGRVLQHLEQSSEFNVDGLQVLVLDEADRILDMGFRDQMLRILAYLPLGGRDGGTRQTMLFSATQTKRVADLAALSLYKPEYIGVHDKVTSGPTPEALQQSYVVVSLGNKLDTIFSFVKSHLKKKSIIFFSSCSQVRHAYDLFCPMQPGVPLLALHGKQKQERRTRVYFDFLQRESAVLFCTDVAARGLDFPNVDWVVQADAPEDKEMYIHRVGRTARYNSSGKALLCLLPSEELGMKMILEEAKVPIKRLTINPTKAVAVSKKACGIVASKPELNALAKKAFKSYLRSIHLMPNKDVFKVEELPLKEYATSLGLADVPSTRFLKELKSKSRDDIRNSKNVNRKLERLKEQIKADKLKRRMEKLGMKIDESIDYSRKRSNEDDDDDIIVIKKHDSEHNYNQSDLPIVDINTVSSSRSNKRIKIEASSSRSNKHVIFDDEGKETENDLRAISREAHVSQSDIAQANEEYLRKVRERLAANKDIDRIEEKDRIRERHKSKKLKAKASATDDGEDVMVTLASDAEVHIDSQSESYGEDINSSDSDSDNSSESDIDLDLKDQEELALAMIRKS